MKLVIDRLEGKFAVAELADRTMVDLDKRLLPPDIKEGDIVEIRVLDAETKKQGSEIEKLMKEVWE